MTAQQRFDEAATAILADAGAQACVHVVDLGTGREVGREPDQRVVTASVIKLPILLAYARLVAGGELDPAGRVRVRPEHHVLGPTGLSVFCDEVDLSLRDLASSMMTVSDNTATDVLLERIGIDRVNAALDEVGLLDTRIVENCADLLESIGVELGLETAVPTVAGFPPAALRALRILDPQRTNYSTARQCTRLLSSVWDGSAAPPVATAEVRRILALQIWPHRVSAGLPEGSRWAGKTGTLPGLRNEVGVAELPDGSRYAIAVFTRADDFADRRPDIDRAIGLLARAGVEALRG